MTSGSEGDHGEDKDSCPLGLSDLGLGCAPVPESGWFRGLPSACYAPVPGRPGSGAVGAPDCLPCLRAGVAASEEGPEPGVRLVCPVSTWTCVSRLRESAW